MGKRYLIHDRDPLFHGRVSGDGGNQWGEIRETAATLAQSDAHAERFVRTIKESCLERMILFGEGSLRRAIQQFVMHYHHERNHQGLGNRLIMEDQSCASSSGAIQRRRRLGGMVNYYYLSSGSLRHKKQARWNDRNQPVGPPII